MSEDEIILTHLLKCTRSELYLQNRPLTPEQQQQFESIKARRNNGEPLQYILGVAHFMGFDFKVTPAVLIPRPETEVLVDEAVKRIKRNTKSDKFVRILDLGTGSGNISIALAKFCPLSSIMAVDDSPEALEIANANAKNHNVDGRIEFIRGSMELPFTERMHGVPECFHREFYFDLVISNPPYISLDQMAQLPKDVQQEPRLALYGGVDGLDFYRNIIKYTPRLLRTGGYLMMEFGDGQELAIKDLIEQQQVFSQVEIIQDLAGKNRIISAQK